MRLFIAIDIDNYLHKEILRYHSDINEDGLRLTSSFHITLKFLGEVSKEQQVNIENSLKKIKHSKLKLTTSQIGFFPNKNHIRVVWLEALKKLQEKVEFALEKFNFKKEFDFHPHITIARVSYLKDKKAFLDKVDKSNIKKHELNVDNFKLYESTLTSTGPIYKILKEYKLN